MKEEEEKCEKLKKLQDWDLPNVFSNDLVGEVAEIEVDEIGKTRHFVHNKIHNKKVLELCFVLLFNSNMNRAASDLWSDL